ncbi:hypothetical protein AKJ09_02311 [Labilithrix luteola]|uniref:Uncharacterized protein n=1 Tax=Labilithrix luteola TaxID=1391654 RepID=A0A0K1PQ45_9BACT|nr:hypothetical protein AKJ09_02311 [Labilithrix luteola]
MTEAALRAVVKEKLGRDPFVDRERADIVIEGEEVSSGARLRARVRERRRDGVVLGSRDIDAETCPRLIRATGIVVALFARPPEEREPEVERGGESERTVDHGARPEERAERAETEPSARVIRIPPSTPRRRPSGKNVPEEPRRSPELSLGLGGSAAVGLLPSVSAATRAVARLELPSSRWSFEWSGGYSLPQSFATRTVHGTLSAVDQQLRVCLALTERRGIGIRIDACGGAFWGAVVPHAVGLRERDSSWRSLAGPVSALAVQLRDSARAARLELGMTAPVAGRDFYFDSTEGRPERLYSTGAVIGFLGVSGLFTIL